MTITSAKQIVVKYRQPAARFVLEAQGSITVHAQGAMKRSPNIKFEFDDAVTIGSRVVRIDSVNTTTAKPIVF